MSPEGPTHPPTDTWIAAIHASEDDFAPIGTGLVIDGHRVLTCAHVITSSQGNVRQLLWVAFPKAGAGSGHRNRVISIALPNFPRVADLAVLRLDEEIPDGIFPAPLRCPKPSDLVNRRWWAFGFANGDPIGNSADGLVGAALGYGWIRLDAESRYHVEPGFSGGGLWSPDYQAVVGLVGEANARGDAHAITLHQADLALPGEMLGDLASWSVNTADELALAAWGWTLARDPEAARHWRPRARGVSIDSERGYRFRGRTAALTAIVNWLDRPRPDRRALVVTGSPGVGKSAVLGRIVTTADTAARASLPPDDDAVRASPGSVACAVHAKGKTALEIATEIARAASAKLPEAAADLGPALRDALAERQCERFNVIIDALDEAANPEQARAVIRQIVLPLVETCADVGAQVVVGSRRRDDNDLLRLFGDAIFVIDLDEAQYFAQADLAEYATACLQLVGDERPDNPYSKEATASPLAHRIAQLADRNFLIAGLIARDHGLHDRYAVDPMQVVFTATVDAALASYLEGVGSVADMPAAAILTALAFAQAPGLPIDLWQLAIEALDDNHITAAQLARFVRSSAANFLVESSGDGPAAVYRLFHQALDDALLNERSSIVSRTSDELALSKAFIRYGKQSNWHQSPDYLLRSLAAHAARAGLIDDLLIDDNYLLYADLRRLIPLADGAQSQEGKNRARVLRLTPRAIAANPPNRAALFSVTEAMENLGSSYADVGLPVPYSAKWASVSVQPRAERAILDGHAEGVRGICAFTLDGQALLASASQDRTVRIWDPVTGEERAVLEGHRDWVRAVCSFMLDGQVLLASASDDGTVRIWDPAIGEQKAVLARHPGWVKGVCAFVLGDRVMLATVGTRSGVRIWEPVTGQRKDTLEDRNKWSTGDSSVCAFTLDGKVLLASGGEDGLLRIWNPVTSYQLATLPGHEGGINGVCGFSLNGRALLASAGEDETIKVWDPDAGIQAASLEGHDGEVSGVCTFRLGNRILLASSSEDQNVRVWDPENGDTIAVLEGHSGWVNGVCAFALGGRSLLASASDDATIRLWDPANAKLESTREDDANQVNGICAFTVDGRNLVASAGDDASVRIWSLATGEHQGTMEGHEESVNAVCALALNDQILLASAGYDGTIRIWNPITGEQLAVLHHRSALRGICAFMLRDRMLLAAATEYGSIQVWNPATRKRIAILEGHDGWVNDICAITLDDRRCLLASASDDTTVRIWSPASRKTISRLEGHADEVHGICSFIHNGRVLLASASSDRTIRIWDPISRKAIITLEGHADEVHGICSFIHNGRVLLASASSDRTIRIWNPATGSCQLTIPTHHSALTVTYIADSLVVGLAVGILVLDIGQTFRK